MRTTNDSPLTLIKRKLVLAVVFGVLLLAGLACNFPGRVTVSEETLTEIHSRAVGEALLPLQVLEVERDQVSLTVEWPIEMDEDGFTAALLETMVLTIQEIPGANSLHIEIQQLGEPFASFQVEADIVRSIENGEVSAGTLFNSLDVEDQRSSETILRRALEEKGFFVQRVEVRDGQIVIGLYIDRPFEASEDLVALWLLVFEQIAEHVSEESRWALQLTLPDYSQTTVTTSSADYHSFSGGSLEPAAFLARLVVVNQP